MSTIDRTIDRTTRPSFRPPNRRGLAMAIVACFLTAGAARGAANLFVEVKADYLPGVDFVGVNAVACERDRPTVCARGAHPATARERAAYLSGVRVAALEVALGRVYRVSATLVSASGRTVARRVVLFDFRRTGAVATLLFSRPEIEALKSGSLADDRDGDGTLSAGDVLRYLVVVRGADRFTDTPGSGASLIPGSVTTTHGTVTDGNDTGDVSVAVQGLGEADKEEGAKIWFDVVVTGVVSNQGVAHKDQAAGASWSSVFQPTDNPATAYAGDPTVHQVGCSLGACEAELAQCEQELRAVRDELTSLTADQDGDGVPAMLDLCPNTPPGTPVNDRGCSRAEFCAQFHVATPAGQLACKHADWRSDEPGVFEPQDCLVLQTTCGST